MSSSGISLEVLEKAFQENTFFESKTWKYSPTPFVLSQHEAKQLQHIGEACLDFYKASSRLYTLSYNDKPILRNSDFKAPWVADYYNIGKPKELIEHASLHNFEKALPAVIRPDLLITEHGLVLTELDCVPGGIGLTAFLYGLYDAQDHEFLGSKEEILEGFYETLAALKPKVELPEVAIVIGENEDTYLPELQYIARELTSRGKPVQCIQTSEVESVLGKVDIIYRFFELFEMKEYVDQEKFFQAVEKGLVVVSPPLKPYQEEKLSLALFHHPKLQNYWQEALVDHHYELLHTLIPKSWVLDPTPVPANAQLIGPKRTWEDLKNAPQKRRNFISKISGFDQTAWGAASVSLGTDLSQEDWSQAIDKGLNSFESNPYIIQEYHKPKLTEHPIYEAGGEYRKRQGRTRLCPYYYVGQGKEVLTAGALATFCPSDKKIIHGMKDAALLPCVVV